MSPRTNTKELPKAKNNGRQCDESKCLSTGLIDDDLFNCYAQGPGTLYPYICADDYIGVRIQDETVEISNDPDVHYYTCCPPGEDDSGNSEDIDDLKRECQDPIEVDPDKVWSLPSLSDTCKDDSPSYPYGRFMTQIPGFPNGYMCCNEWIESDIRLPSTGDDITSVSTIMDDEYEGGLAASPPMTSEEEYFGMTIVNDDAVTSNGEESDGTTDYPASDSMPGDECISSFCDVIDDSCAVENSFGDLNVMNCYNTMYQYPVVTNQTGNTATYHCCTAPQDIDSGFVVTSPAYQATVWTQFSLSFIAALLASTLIISIGRSLHLNNKKANLNTRNRNSGPDYSSYNLYLVFLAIPDLIYNLFMFGIVTERFQNGWIPANDAFITLCATANQYMNAIIAREILVLLQRTKNCRRYAPPSLKKAGIQFGIVITFAIALGVMWLFLLYYASIDSAGRAARAKVAIPLEDITFPFFYLLTVVLPGIYLLWVCFEIWHKKLLPKGEVTLLDPTNAQNSLKHLFATDKWHNFKKALLDLTNTTTSMKEDARDETDDTVRLNQPNRAKGYAMDSYESSGETKTANATANETASKMTNPTSYETATAPVTETPRLSSTANKGRLNVLAMYFLRIILVFFFFWLPGMIIYYKQYTTNRNNSGVYHNIALIFFSLQAIVSNGMALTKPDVKKSFNDLWRHVTKGCSHYCHCFRTRQEAGNDTATSPTAPLSSGKAQESLPTCDVEVAIQDTPKQEKVLQKMPSEDSLTLSDRIMSVNHGVINIGGIQVSQLTTHTISSFNSVSSRVESDSEVDEGMYASFSLPSPQMGHKSLMANVTLDGGSDDSMSGAGNNESCNSHGRSSQRSKNSLKSESKDRRKSFHDTLPGPPKRRNGSKSPRSTSEKSTSRRGAKKLPTERRSSGSSSHFCKLNASNSPLAQLKKEFNGNNSESNVCKSQAAPSTNRRKSTSAIPAKRFNGLASQTSNKVQLGDELERKKSGTNKSMPSSEDHKVVNSEAGGASNLLRRNSSSYKTLIQQLEKKRSSRDASRRNSSHKSVSTKSISTKSLSTKSVSTKSASNKSASNKSASNKSASNKSASNKSASNKSASNKSASNKSASNKSASCRNSSHKSASESSFDKATRRCNDGLNRSSSVGSQDRIFSSALSSIGPKGQKGRRMSGTNNCNDSLAVQTPKRRGSKRRISVTKGISHDGAVHDYY